MAATPDYYKVLGVSKNATDAEIKKAFRRLAREHHPDAGGDEAKFKEINEAYEVLSDDQKRKIYDQYGTAGGANPFGAGGYSNPFAGDSWADILESIRRGEGAFSGNFDFGDLFGFGGFGGGAAQRANRPMKGRDMNVTLQITFEEAFFGCTKTISVRKPQESGTQTIDIKVPAGAIDGGRLRLRGKGAPGRNGGQPGDLLVTTKVGNHAFFKRDGADVLLEIPVTPAEAALGATLSIPTPEGETLRVKVPAGCQHGLQLRLKERGAQKVGTTGKGALICTIKIQVPKDLSDSERALYEQLLDAEQPQANDIRKHLAV